MKVFVKNRNYVFMLERRLNEIIKVQNKSLEAEILNKNNSPIGKKAIFQYEKSKKFDFLETTNSVKVTVGHQIILGLIHVGFYQTNYDKEHIICITDNINPSRFL